MNQETNNNPKFYNRLSIFIFSIFLSSFFGSILLAQNLNEVNRKNKIFQVILIAIGVNIILFKSLKLLIPNQTWITFYLLPNIIGGLIMAFPIWNYYLSDIKEYKNKNVWGPLIVLIILYGLIFTIAKWRT